MKYYFIEFTPVKGKYSLRHHQQYIATSEQISEHVVAEIQTNRYGRNTPIHHDDWFYYADIRRGPKFIFLLECQPRHIQQFVNSLGSTLACNFAIHYKTAKPAKERKQS